MVNVGDKLQVEIAEIDARGKISLVPVQACRATRRAQQRRGRRRSRAGLTGWLRAPRSAARDADDVLERGVDGSTVTSSELPGGLRVVTESVPGARSASVGVWVGRGLGRRDPTAGRRLALPGAPAVQGHQVPLRLRDRRRGRRGRRRAQRVHLARVHLLLRTGFWPRRRSWRSAWSARWCWTRPSRPADVDTERMVILEEIAMRDDDPEDTLADLFAGAVFAGHPVAAPVIGTVETITAMTRTQVAGYYRRRYSPGQDGRSRSPAASITPTCCAGSGRRSASGSSAADAAAAPAGFRTRSRWQPGQPAAPRRWSCSGTPNRRTCVSGCPPATATTRTGPCWRCCLPRSAAG